MGRSHWCTLNFPGSKVRSRDRDSRKERQGMLPLLQQTFVAKVECVTSPKHVCADGYLLFELQLKFRNALKHIKQNKIPKETSPYRCRFSFALKRKKKKKKKMKHKLAFTQHARTSADKIKYQRRHPVAL